MPGGLMQIVAKGAQDQLVSGNPSFTYFRSMYKRHTDFAMEHFRLNFITTNLAIPSSGALSLRARVDRNAQLLNDCYLSITLPNIFSPVVPVATVPSHLNQLSNAIGYEFEWIPNIGYNMINYVALIINGQEIVRHTGEWMKLYAALNFDANKKAKINELVGNVPEMTNPANAWGRMNQYPHAISTTTPAEPSIQGRILTIPFHFWFCEDVGSALPLIAMQYSQVEFVVELTNMYSLFTVLDVRPTVNGVTNPAFGTRIAPDTGDLTTFSMSTFLSPPTISPPKPSNPSLTLWSTNAFIECNYIFLDDTELTHIAKSEHSFIIPQVEVVSTFGEHGPSNDLELTMRNLCKRIVWVAQRSDRALQNDVDNYTNWANANQPPLSSNTQFMTPWYTSGGALSTGVSQRDILLDSSVILDGKERFNYKQTEFFSRIQNYRHETGRTIIDMPGIYSYSFALDNNLIQPAGSINGSMFNRTILRNSYVEPPYSPATGSGTVCVLKDTVFDPKPTIVNPTAVGTDGKLLYAPNDVVTIVQKSSGQTYQYTFNVRAYTESYNFLRVLGGIANVVFST